MVGFTVGARLTIAFECACMRSIIMVAETNV
jgi:hypothetical protein